MGFSKYLYYLLIQNKLKNIRLSITIVCLTRNRIKKTGLYINYFTFYF
jgi:hypothetical protein